MKSIVKVLGGLLSICETSGAAINNMNIVKRVRNYSDWYRPRPPSTPFAADVGGEKLKTTVTILNKDGTHMFIDSYSTMGFKLNNGFRILGPCALFPRSFLHWNVASAEEIHVDSLSLFTVLEPKIDILIVGVGEASLLKLVKPDVYRAMKVLGISLEILPTDQACATFNFLNAEKRYVAAALLPPTKLQTINQDDLLLPNSENIGLLSDGFNPKADLEIPGKPQKAEPKIS